MTSFATAVFRVVRSIPYGTTQSYSWVAKQAGFPKAARAVGNLLSKNRDTTIPCHRVIRSDGTPGLYNGLLGYSKEEVLRKERS